MQIEPKLPSFGKQNIIEASINNKLQNSESLFDPTQQFMQESINSSRIDDPNASKADSQITKADLNLTD